ncbi:MAG: hypothetical protein LBT40_00165 [Deltaproteobacteria bacterium]|jgi:uncharacterized phage infection (PIP) family protein YhgE|nr:hypothetical protein [Deltaproteobacteria bacterium]
MSFRIIFRRRTAPISIPNQDPNGPSTPPHGFQTATDTELSQKLEKLEKAEKDMVQLKSDQTRFLTKDDTVIVMNNLNNNFNSFKADIREDYKAVKDNYKDLKDEFKDLKDGFKVLMDDNRGLKDDNRVLKDGFKVLLDDNRDLKDGFKDIKGNNESLTRNYNEIRTDIKEMKDDFNTCFRHNSIVLLGSAAIFASVSIGALGFLWDIKTNISALHNDRTVKTQQISSPQAVPAVTPAPAQQPTVLPAETPAPPNPESDPSETPSSEGHRES